MLTVEKRGDWVHKYPERLRHQKVLQRIQNILVLVTAFLIFLPVLLELVTMHAHLLICIAYALAALAYGAEIVILILRARKHQVHPGIL